MKSIYYVIMALVISIIALLIIQQFTKPDPTENYVFDPDSGFTSYLVVEFTGTPGAEYTIFEQMADFGAVGFSDCSHNVDYFVFEGDTVLRNIYLEGHMCDAVDCENVDCDPHPTDKRGCGINFGHHIHLDRSGYEEAFLFYDWYMTVPFDIGSYGNTPMKMPGLRIGAQDFNNSGMVRPNLRRRKGGGHRFMSFYIKESGHREENESNNPDIGDQFSDTLTPGKWYVIGLYVKANDPGVDNGICAFYLDGKLLDYQDTINWRNSLQYDWNRVTFSTFIGGSNWPNMVAPQDQYVYNRKLVVGMFEDFDARDLPAAIQIPDVFEFLKNP